ncbi:polysaccharide biosynthesis protein, partial [Alphaproteobacteria bacterium]|nr:polysaccharide biosynthesis protein [Alphaproteobacteria bacterium]
LWFLVKACLIVNIFIFLILFIFNRLENIPRLVIILNFFILTFGTGASRIIYRTIFEKFSLLNSYSTGKIPVLLIGSVDNADSFIRATERNSSIYKVIGIVNDENIVNKEFLIRGIPILGNIKDIKIIIENMNTDIRKPQKVIIVSNNIKGSDMSDIMKFADVNGITVGRALAPNELLLERGIKKSLVRDISLEDLLGRRQNKLKHNAVQSFLKNQTILITGAGGSIGSELSRKILNLNPKKLILLDVSENSIYNLKASLEKYISKKNISFLCSNVRNSIEVEKIFSEHKPHIVYHAAALKHVAICEENVSEAIRTNVLATHILANLSEKYKVKCFVLISTDKAVNPSSAMGATKKLAESIIQSKDRFSKTKTRFITVRFGNVLGSQGSVVPLFKKQIDNGGPITVTHKNVTRFFMTIDEAVSLVLNATLEQYYSKLDLRGSISVLNMGASIKIDILAKQMIKLAGMTPNKEIKIVYTGLKKGEKLHEKLYAIDEKKVDLGNKGFFLVKSEVNTKSDIKKILEKLNIYCNYSNNKIKKNIFNLIKK